MNNVITWVAIDTTSRRALAAWSGKRAIDRARDYASERTHVVLAELSTLRLPGYLDSDKWVVVSPGGYYRCPGNTEGRAPLGWTDDLFLAERYTAAQASWVARKGDRIEHELNREGTPL